jgi:putative N6-adenine-specific DNA methylase
MRCIAKTLYGLESVAESELRSVGIKEMERMNRAVGFDCNQEQLYRINLGARSILRVLVEVSSFKAHNDRHLYSQALKINWEKYLAVDQSFAIDATVNGQRFRHSRYAALKVKDAIVDQFRKKFDERPNINTHSPDIRFNLHISETDVSISLDSSGESLEKRGYRTESNAAPMSECLAAAMVMLSGWDKKTPLLDAMTGSGTIAIEAALFASNTPPSLHRSFGFQTWSDYDKALFNRIELELRNNITPVDAQIVARDVDIDAIRIAKRNARRAGLIDQIQFEQQDFLKASPLAANSFVFVNPPYGERLEEDEEMPAFYGEIGRHLKHNFPGTQLWVISGNLPALKRLGLKPDHRHKVFNGAIECRLNGYTLFEGKRIDQLKQE